MSKQNKQQEFVAHAESEFNLSQPLLLVLALGLYVISNHLVYFLEIQL
jgi:hypothetical protein